MIYCYPGQVFEQTVQWPVVFRRLDADVMLLL